jgi:hypothetical protein
VSSGEKKMAYNRKKVIFYGIAGIVLALTILTFIPTRTETHITTSVNIEQIPGYGIQTIKISEDIAEITNLVINIQSIEAQMPNGEWMKISSREQKWDLRQEIEKIFTIDQNITGYSKLRLNIASDISTVTLSDGRKIQLGLSSLPLEVQLLEPYNVEIEDSGLKLSLSQGTVSNYILPNLQIELSTNKLTGEIVV